ncbi:MAG: hypothetical protein HQ495_05020 [Alphaproteobacteria bacterium]|nr:hypothetical protein [Alphaproteobacteria bacterium]
MKKILILVGGIVLLVVVAAVGMSLVSGGGGEEEEVAEAKVEAPLEAATPVVYDIRPLSVPLIRGDKVRRYLIVVGRYDLLARPDQASLAEENRPLLRDAIVRDVHARPLKLTEDGSVDTHDLEERFLASANRVFAKGIVQSVEAGAAKAGRPAPPAAAPPPPKKSSGGH